MTIHEECEKQISCNTPIPEERLRVFISSAQNEENGLQWTVIRKRIKEYLKKCPYLNPFIIEDTASTTPSNQFFQFQISRADIVILLVKGEVRSGTSIEYTVSTTLKKPLLAYFFKDDNPSLDVVKLKTNIQTTDYCTYREMDSFEGIEKSIFKDILENTIRNYQDASLVNNSTNTDINTVVIHEESEPSKLSMPNKTMIEMFSSSYKYIFDLIGLKDSLDEEPQKASKFHNLGKQLIEWLVTGKSIQCKKEILSLAENLSDLYVNTDWLIKRWDAICYATNGDILKSLDAVKEALNLAKTTDVPKWIVNDILIDYRNIEAQSYQGKGQILVETSAQKELNESDTIIYLPVLDRHLDNVYEGILKEEFKINTASRGTIFYGNNIQYVINNIENYFFSAVLYGSYTHLILARNILADTLRKYGEIFDDSELSFECIKLMIVGGENKKLELFLTHQWDKLYPLISSNADSLWELTQNADSNYRDAIRQSLLSFIGLYLSEKAFLDAEKYLYEFEEKVYWGNSEAYFECIKKNIRRLNSNEMIIHITKIISDKRFHLGIKLADILLNAKIKDVDLGNQINLKNVLVDRLPDIVKNGGTPQLIAALVCQNKDVFSELKDVPDNGLIGVQEKLYKINVGSDDWEPVLNEEIESAKRQFEINRNRGVYSAFAFNPYSMISKIIRTPNETNQKRIMEIIAEKFFPLAIEVLNSEAAIPTKESCISCLCDILSTFILHKFKIPDELVDALRDFDVSKTKGMSLSTNSKETLTLRTFMAKLIVGLVDKEELLKWCVEYSKRTVNERIVFADCIEKYLHNHGNLDSDLNMTVLTIAIQCLEDENYEIRCIACCSMSYLLKSQYNAIVENKLNQIVADPSHYVRNTLLRLCQNGEIPIEIAKKLVDMLSNDANYAIREYAKQIKEQIAV